MKTVDPQLKMLFAGVMILLVLLFVDEKIFPNDGQMFQVVSNLLSGFSGAFLLAIRTQLGISEPPPGTVTRVTDQHTVQVEPKP